MEQYSPNKDQANPNIVLEGQVRECYGRVVYAHKTHEKCADILLSRLSHIKIWQIILSAIITGGFISFFLGSGSVGAGIGVVMSTILLVLNAYTKDYDLGELGQKHRQTATDIWLIREKYLSLITSLSIGNKPIDDIEKQRDELMEELHTIYSNAPSTTSEAYKKAQESLKYKEDMTFTDDEIDAFLPTELKKGRKSTPSETQDYGTDK